MQIISQYESSSGWYALIELDDGTRQEFASNVERSAAEWLALAEAYQQALAPLSMEVPLGDPHS